MLNFRKKIILFSVLFLFTEMVAKAEFLGGFIYNGATTPGGGYTSVVANKQGSATCKNIFIALNDCGIDNLALLLPKFC